MKKWPYYAVDEDGDLWTFESRAARNSFVKSAAWTGRKALTLSEALEYPKECGAMGRPKVYVHVADNRQKARG